MPKEKVTLSLHIIKYHAMKTCGAAFQHTMLDIPTFHVGDRERRREFLYYK